MNVLVIAGRLSRHPWSSGAMVRQIVTGLAARGHDVTLACECAEDSAMFARAARVIERSPFSDGANRFPSGFASWASERAGVSASDITLSLTHRASGRVWMPVDADGASWLAHQRSTCSVSLVASSVLRHRGVVFDIASRAVRPAPSGPEITRVIAVGAPAADATRAFAVRRFADRVTAAPLSSALPLCSGEELALRRQATRQALALAEHRLVVLASFMNGAGRYLSGLLGAVASLNGSPGEPSGPALIILTREPYLAHAAAVRLGCERHVRILGTTNNPLPLLAACDAAATCVPCGLDAFRAGSMSRFASDALRCGRPVLALSGSSGIAALGLTTAEISVPGLVVSTPSAAEWSRALRQASDSTWLAGAAMAAARLAPTLGPDRLIDAVESALRSAVLPAP